jgi:hypothetical protein
VLFATARFLLCGAVCAVVIRTCISLTYSELKKSAFCCANTVSQTVTWYNTAAL